MQHLGALFYEYIFLFQAFKNNEVALKLPEANKYEKRRRNKIVPKNLYFL